MANYVFPVLNSPNASVMDYDSMPPCKSMSKLGDPVDILLIFLRLSWTTRPEQKVMVSIFYAASNIFSALPSVMPLIDNISFLVLLEKSGKLDKIQKWKYLHHETRNNCAKTVGLKLVNITAINTMILKLINLLEWALFFAVYVLVSGLCIFRFLRSFLSGRLHLF